MTNSDIPARLKALREASGLSIRKLAERLGMSSSGYAHYETAARFKDDFLPMTLARDIAAALRPMGVDPALVMALAGGTSAGTGAQASAPGLSEPAASPWQAPPDQRDSLAATLGFLAPGVARPATYRLSRDMPGLGLLRGDIIVVDQRSLPMAGQLALGNARGEDGDMLTVIGRFLPPLLFTPEALTEGRILDVSNGDVAVYHPIVASFRSTALSAP
jgi:transcriptional regulator with XRE-family HTH domain